MDIPRPARNSLHVRYAGQWYQRSEDQPSSAVRRAMTILLLVYDTSKSCATTMDVRNIKFKAPP